MLLCTTRASLIKSEFDEFFLLKGRASEVGNQLFAGPPFPQYWSELKSEAAIVKAFEKIYPSYFMTFTRGGQLLLHKISKTSNLMK